MDSGWLKALELPAKITGGVAAGCIVALVLDSRGAIDFEAIGGWLRPAIAIAAIFSSALFLAGMFNEGVTAFGKSRAKKASLADQAAFKQKALAHLDTLSEGEIHIVAEALKGGSPSVTWWLHSGAAAQLVHRGLLVQLGGQYSSEHWPFVFRDFAWQEMLKRKDHFIERSAELSGDTKKGRR
jgi:hypothetical protein